MAQKNHKTAFIAEHGQEKWDLVDSYKHKDNRSPEAKEAVTLYGRFFQGLNQDTWTVYGILENGVLKYVGSTGMDWRHRWNQHKSAARTLKGARPLHFAMNSTSSNHKLFAEYTFTILHTVSDKDTAKDLEIALIKAHNTHISGYNINIGGGRNTNKFKTRPLSTPNDIETR